MIEAKDLDAIQKVCAELEAQGYSKPRVGIFGATDEKSEVTLSFSKDAAQTPEEET